RGSRPGSATGVAARAGTASPRGSDGELHPPTGKALARAGGEDGAAAPVRRPSLPAGETMQLRPRPQGPRQIELEDPFTVSKRRPEATRTIEWEDPFK